MPRTTERLAPEEPPPDTRRPGRWRLGVVLGLAALSGLPVAGCDPTAATRAVVLPAEAVPYRPELSPSRSDLVTSEPARAPTPTTVAGATAAWSDDELGEDGHGAVVTASAPLRIEVQAEQWQAGAGDPVLRIGDLRFTHYRFANRSTLRFVVADHTSLPVDGAVVLEVGDASGAMVTLASSWEQLR